MKCYKYDHATWKCSKATKVCSTCASTGHTFRECPPNAVLKCINCKGPHKAMAGACPRRKAEVKAEKERLRLVTENPGASTKSVTSAREAAVAPKAQQPPKPQESLEVGHQTTVVMMALHFGSMIQRNKPGSFNSTVNRVLEQNGLKPVSLPEDLSKDLKGQGMDSKFTDQVWAAFMAEGPQKAKKKRGKKKKKSTSHTPQGQQGGDTTPPGPSPNPENGPTQGGEEADTEIQVLPSAERDDTTDAQAESSDTVSPVHSPAKSSDTVSSVQSPAASPGTSQVQSPAEGCANVEAATSQPSTPVARNTRSANRITQSTRKMQKMAGVFLVSMLKAQNEGYQQSSHADLKLAVSNGRLRVLNGIKGTSNAQIRRSIDYDDIELSPDMIIDIESGAMELFEALI